MEFISSPPPHVGSHAVLSRYGCVMLQPIFPRITRSGPSSVSCCDIFCLPGCVTQWGRRARARARAHTHIYTHVSATTVPAPEKKPIQKITPNFAVSYVAFFFRIFEVPRLYRSPESGYLNMFVVSYKTRQEHAAITRHYSLTHPASRRCIIWAIETVVIPYPANVKNILSS
jgi:hypothetical protein